MNTLEFLQRILPTSGYYALFAVAKNKIPLQRFYSDINGLAEACILSDSNGIDTYYGISSFKEKGSRKQENIQFTKTVPVDIDCGPNKPYPSAQAGAVALLRFVKDNALPVPMVVRSGGGIHGYWVFNEPMEQEAWKAIAATVKAAATAQNLYIDTGKTGDGACVLRPTGTSNYKLAAPRPVSVLYQGQLCTPGEILDALAGYLVSKRSHSVVTSPLLKALEIKQDYPPSDPAVILEKCNQIKLIVAKRGDVEEPIWYASLGVAGYCADADNVAISWSRGHADFNEANTIRKMEQWKAQSTGPTLCTHLENLTPGGCEGCKHKGKVSTPVRLGIRHAEVEFPVGAPDEEAGMVGVPKPFVRTVDGIKVIVDGVQVDVFPYDIYPLGQGKDEHLGYEVARYKWNRPYVGWQLLELPVRDLAEGGRDFGKCIGDAGITPANRIQATYMSVMLRNFMAELNRTKAASNLHSSMGWKEDFSEFVLGGIILRRNKAGAVEREPIGLSKNAPKHLLNAYSQKGTLADWVAFTNILNDPDLAYYRFVLGTSFGCPLWAFGGLGGVVISLFGETGAGKTTIQNWVQSVYGNPAELLIPAVATQNATFSRLGVYNNLPATIDEMSVLPAKDTANFIYWASLGKDKPRLNMEAVEKDTRKFSTMIIGSTNMSLNAKLLSANTENTALSMRLLELTIPRHNIFASNSDKGRQIYGFLHANYGTAGLRYVEHLVGLGVDRIRAMVNESLNNFRVKYGVNFTGEERFWEHAIILSDLGNSIAKSIGLINYDYEAGTEWVLRQVDPLRKGVQEQSLDCFDILSAFLSEHSGSSLVVTHSGSNTPHYDLNRIPRDEILIRYNLFRKLPTEQFTSGVVYINRVFFFRWLTSNGHDPKTVKQSLFDAGVINQPLSDRYYMGRDTGVKSGQIYVIGINLSHPRLAGVLNDMEATGGLGQLKEVKK